jgi:hypothetical protein
MNSRKVYYGMIAALVLCIALLGAVVVYGNKYLHKQSTKLMSAKLDQKSLNEQQTALIKAKRDLQKYSELQQVAKGIVPQDKDQARAVREIVNAASASGVTLESITFDDSTLGAKSTTPAPATGQDKAPTKSKPTSPLTQVEPVDGIAGVYSMPIAIVSTKNNNQFANFVNFLGRLENNRRTAHVEEVSITPGTTQSGKDYINFSLTLNIFVKP